MQPSNDALPADKRRSQSSQPASPALTCRRLVYSTGLIGCIFLLAVACNSAAPPADTSGTGVEEDAIEHFIAAAPSTVQQRKPLPTPLPKSAEEMALPPVNPLGLLGDLRLAGNRNLLPLTNQIYQRFVADGYAGVITMQPVGSSEGIAAFCRDDLAQPPADLAATTRLLLETEFAACMQQGRVPLAFPVALDALVVVVPSTNDFVQDVSMAEVTTLFTARRWADVKPTWPSRGIITVLPSQGSDELAFFAERFFADNLQLLLTTQESFFSQDDVESIQHMLDQPDTIGVINYTTYLQYRNALRLVKIAGQTPDLATIQGGKWPLSRPLLLYTTAALLQRKAQLRGFLTYYLTNLHAATAQVGKFTLPPVDLNRSKRNLLVGTANEFWLADVRERRLEAGATSQLTVTRPLTESGSR